MVSCFQKRNVGICEFSPIETKSCHTTTRVVYVIGYRKVYPNLEDNTIPCSFVAMFVFCTTLCMTMWNFTSLGLPFSKYSVILAKSLAHNCMPGFKNQLQLCYSYWDLRYWDLPDNGTWFWLYTGFGRNIDYVK